MKKLILISGPSCVGKGPLLAALKEFHSDIRTGEIPIIKSKECRHGNPRPNEADQWNDPEYFMQAAEIEKLDTNRYFVGDCRGFPQAIHLDKIRDVVEDVLILEVYHTIGAAFREWADSLLQGIRVYTVFISPLSEDEMLDLQKCGVNIQEYLQNIMIHKQLIRNKFMNRAITNEAEAADIRKRAEDAYSEIQSSPKYMDVIVNHDGEGHADWNIKNNKFVNKPEGDAGRALNSLLRIITTDVGSGKCHESLSAALGCGG